MSTSMQSLRMSSLCSSCSRRVSRNDVIRFVRPFSQRKSIQQSEDTSASKNASVNQAAELDLSFAHTKKQLQEAARTRTPLVGSLRSRWARSTNDGIPFEQLPYQCFQEARKVLAAHRNETLKKIELMRGRIARLSEKSATTQSEIVSKQHSLTLMRKKLEDLKIEADINDPLVKKRFEDGLGDMNKPIYRHLADKKWREYRRLLVLQRLEQMSVVPDVVSAIDPVAAVDISFPDAKSQPGEFVQAVHSQVPPLLEVQVFNSGPRLVTVVVVDSDVPDFENDDFTHRCHGAYTNIEISPTSGKIDIAELERAGQSTILPWLPPHALKGSPYHRLSVFVLEHHQNEPLDVASVKEWMLRDDFKMRTVLSRTRLKLIGATMFRTQWDETTEEVMRTHNLPGLDIQMKRKPAEKAPYKRRDTSRMRG